MAQECNHFTDLTTVPPSGSGCVECLEIGGTWVHLRACVACGHIGCCDQSPNQHATKHYRQTEHPVIRSFEPGEAWWYCFADDAFVEIEGVGPLRT
jgi:uncharacterized UBP type Zn finger protein